MKIGLYDVDSRNFPNLALMKLSAYHKSIGDEVEMYFPLTHSAPAILRDLQRWCNNRFIYRSVPDFFDYVPRVDGKTIRELYEV